MIISQIDMWTIEETSTYLPTALVVSCSIWHGTAHVDQGFLIVSLGGAVVVTIYVRAEP